jgi:hypothetical protein
MIYYSNRPATYESPDFLATALNSARAPSIYIIPPRSFRSEMKDEIPTRFFILPAVKLMGIICAMVE